MKESFFDTYDKSLCCGCSACYSICPHKAIRMVPDGLGFLYPEIQQNECINCTLCREVCTFNNEYDTVDNVEPQFYAVRHKNPQELLQSRSGAAFVAISDLILEKNGVIYGVGFKEHFKVCHKRAVTKEQRDEFRGSKYVQSELGDIFSSIKQDLKENLLVLFSGTGCQTAGLKSYLKKCKMDTSNLILVDIVCHGVPSPYFWRDYLSLIEKKYGKQVIKVNFRDKKFGWKDHRESFTFEDIYTYTYTYTFYKHIMLRHSCEKCFYTNTTRPSDITLADFWGWEKVNTEFNKDNNGVSLVILNTQKGIEIFEKIKFQLNYIKTEREKCLQTHLREPSKVNQKRLLFEKDYIEKGFEYVLRKYCDYGKWNYIKSFPKKLIRKVFRLIKDKKTKI